MQVSGQCLHVSNLEELLYVKISTLMPTNKPQMIAVKNVSTILKEGTEHYLAELGKREWVHTDT